jgi:hypothetical protein
MGVDYGIPMMPDEPTLRQVVTRFLSGETHMSFDEAVAEYPLERMNDFPPSVPYTPWQLLEHIRITQHDILDFMRNPDYREPDWPRQYWPESTARADADAWHRTIKTFHADLEELLQLVQDSHTDLSARIRWGTGQTIIEELIKVSDHTSYHLGEFAILRQVMGTWPASRQK